MNLKKGICSLALTGTFMLSLGAASASLVQAQDWRWRQEREIGRQREWERQRELERLRRMQERQMWEQRRMERQNYPYGYNNNRYSYGYPYGYDNRYGYGNNYGYNNAEAQQGYRDGLTRGREDAQSRRTPTPNNSQHFREGNAAYRQGFARGYQEGYQQYRRW